MSTLSYLPSPFPANPIRTTPHPHPPNQIQTLPLSLPDSTDHRLRTRLLDQSNASDLRGAISTLDTMLRLGHPVDPTSFSLLLKSCIRSRRFDLGKLLHSRIPLSGLPPDTLLLNSLITLYSKSRHPSTALRIFHHMDPHTRDIVSWSAIISCLANNSLQFDALRTFCQLLTTSALSPNEFCFAAVIRACSNHENARFGEGVFGMVLKTGFFADLCVGCALIDMFVKGFADLGSAREVFDQMPERNVVSWTLMISRLVQMGSPEDAVELFLEMEACGYVPDRFTFTAVISACVELKWLGLGKQMHSRVIRSGLASDACVACSLVDMYSKSRAACLDSRKVFDEIAKQNVMSWTAVITAYVQSGGRSKDAIKLFVDMLRSPVMPNHFTFATVLKACANLEDAYIGEQVHGHVVKRGLGSDDCVGNAVISMYTHSSRMDEARKAFDVLFEKNLVSYNTIVDGYVRNMDSDEAFELLGEIEKTGMAVNAFTLTSLISGTASTGAGGKGEVIHARVIKTGFESNKRVCNTLIDMYSKCGEIEAAYKVFCEIEGRNVVSWTSIITGFAKHGLARRALETFKKMEEAGVEPNEVTYVAVLSACSHVGMVSEGWKHFQSMSSDHGISPRMEHYACMVDLLGRSGLLVEALELINSMPFKANCLVWRTLLGACQVHGDTKIGEHAAKAVLQQDPYDPSAYTLLSNLYASKDQWEDVAQIRKDMKEKSLTKEAGCSWTEIENRVHKFYVGDTSHLRAEEIYEELRNLVARIKEMGYVPDTSCVLHDIEEEQKELYLLQHSEKVAVAFGFISTPSSKPIKVFKNLRVCGDCHTAMKYISCATGREIVLRDSNRFHHFRDGSCSCNDYW